MSEPKQRIMVIDDEADFCFFVKKNLELAGAYEVVTCSDSRTAVADVLAAKPDLILLDVMMPYLDGFTILRQLRAHGETSRLPIILLTAKGDTWAVFEGKLCRATDFIIKPFELKELLRFIKKYLVS